MRDCNSLQITSLLLTSLKQKREERQFAESVIISILHGGNEFLK